jgi:transglutaminase-like putative cysteine protease
MLPIRPCFRLAVLRPASWTRFVALAGLALLAAPRGLPAKARPTTLPETPRTLTTHFTYKATIPETPAGTRTLDLWIPLPSNSPWQTVSDLQVDAPVAHRITQEKKYGNRMVYLRIEKPSAPMDVTVQFTVVRREIKVLGTPDPAETAASRERGFKSLRLYLAADSRVPKGGRYTQMAREIVGEKATAQDKVRAIFESTVANMQYDYKKESPKYAQGDVAFVCDYKKGNCSDLHSYIISLSRSLDIPAVLEYGFPLTGIPFADPLPKEGTIAGYHCWTWIKDPQAGWFPLDASDARRWLDAKNSDKKEFLFGNLVLERAAVAFSQGRDIDLVPKQKGEALNNFIYPYAEADGQAVPAKWEVRYRLP